MVASTMSMARRSAKLTALSVRARAVFPTPTPRRILASKQRRDRRERRATRAVAVVGGDRVLIRYAPDRSRASFSL